MSDLVDPIASSEKKTVLSHMPKMAWIALTGKCNLRCDHCPVVRQAENNEEMEERIYERVGQDILPHLKQVVLGANNYGEQTISKKIDTFLEKAFENNISVKLWTNGTLMNESLLRTIIRTDTDVAVSMEGYGKNYQKIRHYPYKKLEKSIHRFLELRKAYDKTNTIEIAYTLFRSNRDDLFELIKTGVDKIGVSYLKDFDRRWEREILSMQELEALRDEFFPRLIQEASLYSVTIDYNKTRTGDNIETASLNCTDPWCRVNIRENGDVLPCCIAGDDLIMGNLKTKHFEDIWNGKRYQKLRNSFLTQKLMGTCRTCKGISSSQKKELMKRMESSLKHFLVKRNCYGLLNRLIEIKRSYYRR